MIALLAALEGEISDLRRQMALTPESVAGLDGAAYAGSYQGRSVLLAWTGMGRMRAERGAQAVLARYPVTAVISIGFSGALDASLAVSDLVLAPHLIGVTGADGRGLEPATHRADPVLLRAAAESLGATPLRVVQGATVTTPGLVDAPARKQELGRRTGVVAVDMESYWVAKVASERGLPFLALRVISDAQQEPLPPMGQIVDDNGAPNVRPLIAHLIRAPGSAMALARMARNARRARRALTAAVACAATAL